MDRWASGRGWAGPNANGPPLLDWAGPLLDWVVTAGPCRKLGCSRPSELRVSVRVRALGFRGRVRKMCYLRKVVNTPIINQKYFTHGWQNDDFAPLEPVGQN
ncbi:hypothetical protein CRG98_031249 [Punica granatum]|uniref:Uncharacterized protein n=1 Tax=Punica granatum TaxID=22663 RepID=A0A2I0IY91_PUNGR|nr:hypothetical protein CRG98_031249 [Punica granatum]